MRKIKVGIVGCGKISDIYLKNCSQVFKNLEIAACSDMLIDRAKAKASEYGIPRACAVEELLGDRDIEIVLNLTIPQAHFEIASAALSAGKHVYNEKPLGITREEGQTTLSLAKERGLRVGCAPDTFLGGGLQTCRKLLDDGWIGRPAAATAFMLSHGPEGWHPNPEIFYQKGAGPLFDIGPYYLTALVFLLGPVAAVAGMARTCFPERVIMNQQRFGERFCSEVPTHVAALLEFSNGAAASMITSFDSWGTQLPRIEVYGSEGTMIVPDPNTFGGPIFIKRRGWADWKEIPLVYEFTENSRGIGLSEMAFSLDRSGEASRAGGELAYHVLDVMHSIYDASSSERHVKVVSTCPRPRPLCSGPGLEALAP